LARAFSKVILTGNFQIWAELSILNSPWVGTTPEEGAKNRLHHIFPVQAASQLLAQVLFS